MTTETVDAYILQYPKEQQMILQKLRLLIKEEAPQAEETIRWGMPTYRLHGNLVHFAMAKKHIGFYPGNSGVEAFEDQLSDYKHSKGTIQLPLSKPIPEPLIRAIIRYRIRENMEA